MKYWAVGLLLLVTIGGAHATTNTIVGSSWSTSYVGVEHRTNMVSVKHSRTIHKRFRHKTKSNHPRAYPAGYEDTISSISPGPRPHAWCGWFMRLRHGGGPVYNQAIAWAHRGVASIPFIGAIVVWPHHVGEITGYFHHMWVILSGNSGPNHSITEHPRPLTGVVAIRRL